MKKTFTETAKHYFKRFNAMAPIIDEPISSEVGIAVVIPCFNEPDLLTTLDSLWKCKFPNCHVEVITVINSGKDATGEIKKQNLITLHEAKEWTNNHQHEKLKFHFLHFDDFPKKHAGVGLARKTGMDEALHRFGSINVNGIIVCLDADCRVEGNYLTAIEECFTKSDTKAGVVYYEHDLSREDNEAIRAGIIKYELSLRYYVQALRFTGYPYAYHTVGSCMAVRAETYSLAGGMNKRKAGEDFYFLHKIIPNGNFDEINNTCVYPSPRMSDRVPFGTGKAMLEWMKRNEKQVAETGGGKKEVFLIYNYQTFEDLKQLIASAGELFNCRTESKYRFLLKKLPGSITTFLEKEGFYKELVDMIGDTSSTATFMKRFYNWFNGLKVVKFLHYARDNFYSDLPVEDVCRALLSRSGNDLPAGRDVKELLMYFRNLDRRMHNSPTLI